MLNDQACQIVENPDPATWDGFVRTQGGHLLQSSGWGELKSRFGWSALRVGLEQEGALIAGAQILFRPLPLGLRLAYIPRGPVADPTDAGVFAAVMRALDTNVRSHGAFALKVEPDWTGPTPASAVLESARPAEWVQPSTSIRVDLTRDLDAILAGMKSKWRYNIRLAERKGITVRQGRAEDMPVFYDLMRITGTRDRFGIHSLAYYRAAFDLLRDDACLLIAEYEGEALAAIFVTAFGDEAIYLYGASSNAHRDRMPNHAVQWAAMKWARARGCKRYDLWGVPDNTPELADDNKAGGEGNPSTFILGSKLPTGLMQFKQGFGGEVVHYEGARDVVYSPLKYAVYKRALSWRRGRGIG